MFLVGLAKLHCGTSPPSVMVLYFQVVDTLEVLAECLAATPAARVHWTQAYTSNLGPSGQLLNYLGKMDELISMFTHNFHHPSRVLLSYNLLSTSFLLLSTSYFHPADSNWIRYRADLDEPELQETIEAFQVF